VSGTSPHPGRYVGAAEVDADDVPFENRFAELKGKLEELFVVSARLEAEIRKNLGRLGM
jgi:type I restriction enzyme M protein